MKKLSWKKFDLHYHTNDDKARTNISMERDLKTFSDNNFSLIAITNHGKISLDCIKKYRKHCEVSGYDINILPGVELKFEMQNKDDEKSAKIGNLNIIFSEKMTEDNIKQINKIFQNKDYYDDINAKKFNDSFLTLISQIKQIYKFFIVLVCFDKAENNITYENSPPNSMRDYFYSFDLMEGNVLEEKSLNRMKKSLYMAGVSKTKGFVRGSDAHSSSIIENEFGSLIENIKKIPWFLAENNFEGLEDIVLHPDQRISFENNPYLLSKKIDKIIIKTIEKKEVILELEAGLNTIVGRRGSGKSYLLNKIYDCLCDNNDDFFEIVGEYNKNNVLYLKQNQLADHIKPLQSEMMDSLIDTYNIFSERFNGDRKTFSEIIHKYENEIIEFKKNIFNLLKVTYEKIILGEESSINATKLKLYNSTIKNLQVEKEIELNKIIESDLNIISNIIENETFYKSEWLIGKMKLIRNELNKIKTEYRFGRSISSFKIKLEFEKNKVPIDDSSRVETLISTHKQSLEKNQIKNKYKELIKFKNIVSKIYNEISNNNYYMYKEQPNQSYDFINYDLKIIGLKDMDDKYNNYNYYMEKFLKVNYSLNTTDKKITLKDNSQTNESFKNIFNYKLITKIDGENLEGMSVGTQHEHFIKNILKIQQKEIILLDQPDDDLDAITIEENITKIIKENSHSQQWIVVSHDPKICVNADSKKMILCNYKEASTCGEKQSVHNQCDYINVDKNYLRTFVHKILDSKSDYPHTRSKIYWKENTDD